jgi:hypothetical protein
MKKKDIIFERTIKSALEDCFIKDGRFIPQYNEDGSDAGLVISANVDDPEHIACPYCGGADNILEKEDIGGKPISAKNLDGGDPRDVSVDGFRCASCNLKWVMLRFNKCMAVAVGYESEKSKGRAS